MHLTIESIGAGKVKPSRIVLWLDEFEALERLPRGLKRASRRGLEIRNCENLGPHKKYYPYVSEAVHETSTVLVTADDDVLYPRGWMSDLSDAHSQWPNDVLCFRAHRIRLANDGIAPYLEWGRESSTVASHTVFATGVSGVLYPSEMVRQLRAAGRAFDPVARSTDDIWLHRVALRSGIKARQVVAPARLFLSIPSTNRVQLASDNVAGGKNDAIISELYEPSDVRTIQNEIRS
ncbi:hypothetical protein IEZ26_02365 [Nocardioides cavernae]|uniref:Glycosyltransferase n=1 Tax=Nocardioides cavernae TaxID=1921566 RepID=A0ABR8N7C1_9ACTN|nr:hypothetical protein [Nocardioides cavernae]MBD3923452.1 hypothetical protein [Nocardioides cavernae]MBM7511623.1 hypothetical protein [Nocardioides cavernae]